MKNVIKNKNLKKCAAILMLAVLMICSLTACQTNKEAGKGGQQGTMYMGEITAIDGKELTVNVMSGGMGGMFGGQRPSAGEMPEGFDPESFDPENFDPESMPEGFGGGNMPTGETMTIKVTNKIDITVNGEKGKVSDLQVGDFVMITVEDEMVTAISAGMMQQFAPQQSGEKPVTQ